MLIHCSMIEWWSLMVENSRTSESPHRARVLSCLLYVNISSRCSRRHLDSFSAWFDPECSSLWMIVLVHSLIMLHVVLTRDGRPYPWRWADPAKKSKCLNINSGSSMYLLPMVDNHAGDRNPRIKSSCPRPLAGGGDVLKAFRSFSVKHCGSLLLTERSYITAKTCCESSEEQPSVNASWRSQFARST
jgi:hypothetical protein